MLSLAPDAPELSQEWQRDHAVHILYDVLLAPLFALDQEQYYPAMKASWNAFWDSSKPHFPALVDFARVEIETATFRDVQRDLFAHLQRYVDLVGSLLPGLLCNLLPVNHQPRVDAELRLFRDDYEMLRDFYIQAFETCHKGLRWIVGVTNIALHGNADTFVTPADAPDLAGSLPTNLNRFSRLVNARKRAWLVILPEWHAPWDDLFDRQMRNDIGHASARHDLERGKILRGGGQPLAYTRFVARTQRVLYALLAVTSALKILRVYALMPSSDQGQRKDLPAE